MASRAIVIQYLGGLGNRLFQLAAGIAFAEELGGRLFAVDPDDAVSADLHRLIGEGPPAPTSATLFRLGLVPPGSRPGVELGVRAARTLGWARERRLASGSDPWSSPSRTPTTGPLAIVGYAQHPEFFARGVGAVVDLILADRGRELRNSAESPLGPVLHLRRGDYVQLRWELSIDYYRASLVRLSALGRDSDDAIEVIGDDRLACAGLVAELRRDGRNVQDIDPGFGRAPRSICDFWRIASASVVVMSNSTFCWWATVVGDALRSDRTVVFPARWLGGGSQVLRRSAWIAIDG